MAALLAARVYEPLRAAWASPDAAWAVGASVQGASVPLPPALEPADMALVARSFPVRSASLCGWHPKHFAMLGSPASHALCILLRAAEVYG